MNELANPDLKAVMALESDSRARGVLSKLWNCEENNTDNRKFDHWNRAYGGNSLVKYCSGEIQGNEVLLLVTKEPLESLSQLGFDSKEVVFVLGNDTRGPGEISLNPEDIHLRCDHPFFGVIRKFSHRVGVYKESKDTLRNAANLIAGVLFRK